MYYAAPDVMKVISDKERGVVREIIMQPIILFIIDITKPFVLNVMCSEVYSKDVINDYFGSVINTCLCATSSFSQRMLV